MEQRRWLNQSQPQTLVIACFLLYINAAFRVLDLVSVGGGADATTIAGFLYFVVPIVGGVAAAYGIANERKFGYILGLITAFAPFALSFYLFHNPLADDLLNLIFDVALVALLLHTQSREYQKIWFK